MKDVLVYAKTPIRKGVKTIDRKPFVLTSRTWQYSERAKLEDKKKKFDDIQKRKAERLLKKNQKAKKKVEPKKKIAIPETKKINVISDITLTETEKRCTKSILAINKNTTKEPQVFRTPEKIEKVKLRLFFDKKETKENIIKKRTKFVEETPEKLQSKEILKKTETETKNIPKTDMHLKENSDQILAKANMKETKGKKRTTFVEEKPESLQTKEIVRNEIKTETKNTPMSDMYPQEKTNQFVLRLKVIKTLANIY